MGSDWHLKEVIIEGTQEGIGCFEFLMTEGRVQVAIYSTWPTFKIGAIAEAGVFGTRSSKILNPPRPLFPDKNSYLAGLPCKGLSSLLALLLKVGVRPTPARMSGLRATESLSRPGTTKANHESHIVRFTGRAIFRRKNLARRGLHRSVLVRGTRKRET